jgi:hypothetical protein
MIMMINVPQAADLMKADPGIASEVQDGTSTRTIKMVLRLRRSRWYFDSDAGCHGTVFAKGSAGHASALSGTVTCKFELSVTFDGAP